MKTKELLKLFALDGYEQYEKMESEVKICVQYYMKIRSLRSVPYNFINNVNLTTKLRTSIQL